MPVGDLLAAGVEAMTEAAFRTGDYTLAEKHLRAALETALADGDRDAEATASDRLGWLMHFQTLDRGLEDADPDAEEALFTQALTIRRARGDLAGVAESLFGVGLVHQVLRRDWAKAKTCFFDALPLAEEHGDYLIRSEIHRHVGFYYLVEDVDLDRAIEHLEISLELREQHGDPRWVPSGTLALGQAEWVAGRQEVAVGRLRDAVREARAAALSQRRISQAETWLQRAESGETPSLR
jgi:tetratricopeptide (TPR) repeat protein